MEYMHDLLKKLCEELDEIAQKPEMSAGDLEAVHKLTDTIKNLYKIDLLEGGGYDEDGYNGYERDSSYRGRKRDSMGRYSRDYRMGNIYPRADAKDHMLSQMERMMDGANDKERGILRRAMEQLEKA